MSRAPITDEMLRILAAIEAGTFHVNSAGRYVIAGEPRPDRRSRELLRKRGLIDWSHRFGEGTKWHLTDGGREALRQSRGGETCA